LFKKAESGQTGLITKIQLWMYRVIKGIPEQSPTWEVAELRKGKEEFEAWHSLWCHAVVPPSRGDREREISAPPGSTLYIERWFGNLGRERFSHWSNRE
jgi:hypothetical protein